MGKYRKSSCGSRHCCGSEEIQIGLWRERSLLRQWGNVEKAPAGADTAAAVGKYSYGSCGSTHCCGSGEIRLLLERELLGWLMWRWAAMGGFGDFKSGGYGGSEDWVNRDRLALIAVCTANGGMLTITSAMEAESHLKEKGLLVAAEEAWDMWACASSGGVLTLELGQWGCGPWVGEGIGVRKRLWMGLHH